MSKYSFIDTLFPWGGVDRISTAVNSLKRPELPEATGAEADVCNLARDWVSVLSGSSGGGKKFYLETQNPKTP